MDLNVVKQMADTAAVVKQSADEDHTVVNQMAHDSRYVVKEPTLELDSREAALTREQNLEIVCMARIVRGIQVPRVSKPPRLEQALSNEEHTRLNGTMVFAKAAVVYRQEHGRFPQGLQRQYFYLVHRFGRIRWRQIAGYPSNFTAKDIALLPGLLDNLKALGTTLSLFVGLRVLKGKKATTPISPLMLPRSDAPSPKTANTDSDTPAPCRQSSPEVVVYPRSPAQSHCNPVDITMSPR